MSGNGTAENGNEDYQSISVEEAGAMAEAGSKAAGRVMEMFGKLDPDDPEKIVQDEYQSAAGGVMRSKDLGAFMEDFLGAPEHHYSSVPIIVHGQPVCTLCVTDNKHHEASTVDLSKLEAIAAKAAKAITAKATALHPIAEDSTAISGAVKVVDSKAEWDGCLEEAAKAGKPLIVDFTASWCGPCKAIAPKFEAIAAATPGALFAKVDVHVNEEVAHECGVSSMPTFQVFRAGKKVGEMAGADEPALRALVAKHVA